MLLHNLNIAILSQINQPRVSDHIITRITSTDLRNPSMTPGRIISPLKVHLLTQAIVLQIRTKAFPISQQSWETGFQLPRDYPNSATPNNPLFLSLYDRFHQHKTHFPSGKTIWRFLSLSLSKHLEKRIKTQRYDVWRSLLQSIRELPSLDMECYSMSYELVWRFNAGQ